MGEKGHRGIQRLTEDTLILSEIVQAGKKAVKKRKLIKLNPTELRWYNIQLEGSFKHSIFLYHIQPEGPKASRLTFTGLIVVYSRRRPSASKIRAITSAERQFDAHAWTLLAKEMEEDLATQNRD
jgi:hypothetical protein